MEIKVIDLLNMISKGEKVPEKVKWGIHIFELYEGTYTNFHTTIEFKGGKRYKTLEDYLDYDYESLNEEVEILEEEKKIPEKIEYYDDSIAWVIDDVGQLSDVDKVIIDTLNGVIDYLNKKGDE